MSETITLTSKIDGFRFSALHEPAQGRRRGGIVIIQEIFGLDRYVQEDVTRWSALGFEAVAPAMFDRQQPGFVADHDPDGMAAGRAHVAANGFDNPVSDIQACIDFLAPRGPVFLVGYCYGGLVSWLAAAKVEGLAAASCYYGRLKDHASLKPRSPVIAHFGRKDQHIPADETKAALAETNPQVAVYIYENSGHGFNNDGVPAQDPADAKLARERTLALFAANGAG